MQRKLVKQGQNAMTVTLPANWIKQQGLDVGDVVDIQESVGELVVSSTGSAKKQVSTIDVQNQTSQSLWHLFQAAYFRGDDEIQILHTSPSDVELVVKEHMGMVLTRHTGTKSYVKSIVTTPGDDLDAVMNRCIFMFKEQSQLLHDGEHKQVKAMERHLDFHIRYCLRYIVKYYKGNDAYRHFYFLMVLEESGDKLSEMAKHKLGGEQRVNALNIVNMYCNAVLAKDFSVSTKLHQLRKSIPKKTYADALVVDLLESLYNFFGFLTVE